MTTNTVHSISYSNIHNATSPQPQRLQNPLPRRPRRHLPAPLHSQRPNDTIHRMRQHSLHPGPLQILRLLRFPPHHPIHPVTLRQPRQARGREDLGFAERGQVLRAEEGRVVEDIGVFVVARFLGGEDLGGCCGGAEEGERGLQVDDAFAEEGEAVVEAAAAVVEGFVGYG